MEEPEIKLDIKEVKLDLIKGIHACSQRGLKCTVKWLSEINYALSHIKLNENEFPQFIEDCITESESYLVAKSYFDLKEYDRCAFFTENCTTPKVRFLNLYAKYLSIEKNKLDNMTDTNCPPDPTKNNALRDLCLALKSEHFLSKLDGYCLYLYGVILKKLELNSLAVDVFVEAINEEPLHWGSWQELAYLIPNKRAVVDLPLPDHWMKWFFLAHVYLEQLNNEEALSIYCNLHTLGFEKSTYIMAQMAIASQNRRELDKAIVTFKELLAMDPYRLDNLDTYSNILYVKEMKTELADLAHVAVNIDKYRVETCCVIGNYYSLRSEHQKAVLYFQRALKLNPQYLSAWTLMGHEYMEMKNTNAAIQSYRQAIEVNKRDYRAWYGLGQTYEILKMPFYCTYYYKQAQQLRPNDSRMIIALGETYEKLDKIENALKCYYKACNVGDIEGMALIKLAKLVWHQSGVCAVDHQTAQTPDWFGPVLIFTSLINSRLYDKLNEPDNAAAAYTEYCLKEEEQRSGLYDDQSEFYNALQYLGNFYLMKGMLDDAYTYAYKCLEYDETKEQGKSILKTIAARRGRPETEPPSMEQDTNEPNSSNMDMTYSSLP